MDDPQDRTDDVLRWRVWPAGQNPTAAFAAAMLTAGLVWYAYEGLHNLLFAVAAVVVMIGGLASFWFPGSYRLDPDGARVTVLWQRRRASWGELSCYLRGTTFIALSTTSEPDERSLRDGLILRLAGNGDEVERYVARHLPEWSKPASE